MKLLIVIVNYATAGLTGDCLASVAPQVVGREGVRVVVTDNLSPDDSRQVLPSLIEQRGWSTWCTFMPLPVNGGFAYGNNAAIRPALEASDKPQYVLLLNPDTVVRPGAIDALVSFMDAHPNVGIAGSRLEDPDGTPQRSAFRFPTVSSEVAEGLSLGVVSKVLNSKVVAPPVRDEAHETDWVAGASMIVRREVLEQVGLFDETYFMYFEEVDFCLAARRAGWACWYVPASHVVHLVGQASGVTDTKKPARRLPAYWFESRRRYFVKNHGAAYAAAADASFAGAFAIYRLREPLKRNPRKTPPHMLKDFLKHSVFARGFSLPRAAS